MNNFIDENIYNNYFGKTPEEKSTVLQPAQIADKIFADEKSKHTHFIETVTQRAYTSPWLKHVADDNIDDIEQLAEILQKQFLKLLMEKMKPISFFHKLLVK